jgi:GAF domain-containing protein
MSGREPELPGLRLELAGLGASAATVEERAAAILQQLGRILPFDAGWLALRNPERHLHLPLATTGAGRAPCATTSPARRPTRR